MPSLCQNIKTSYEYLQKLTADFTAKYSAVKDRGDLEEIKRLQKDLEAARDTLLEHTTLFIVPNATNSYYEALLAAGLDLTEAQEEQETRLDLRKEIERQLSVYREAKNKDGRPLLERWVKDITENKNAIYAKIAKDQAKIRERIKAGMIPIVMPGRSTQEGTWYEALTYLQPTWIQNGEKETLIENNFLDDLYLTDITDKMTEEGFFKHIPEQPYLVWVKPSQGPDPKTMKKSFDDQQDYYATLVEAHPNLYDPTDLIPTEYLGLQAMATSYIRERFKQLRGETKEPMTIIPLDYDGSFTCFLSAGLFSSDDVPMTYFESVVEQLRFDWIAEVDKNRGFRPASRT